MTVTQRVSAILHLSRAARNSDKDLWLIYAQKSGMNLSPHQVEVFRSMPSPETIRRTRQKLQMEGKYPADTVIEERRYQRYREVKQNIKSLEPETLLETTLENSTLF